MRIAFVLFIIFVGLSFFVPEKKEICEKPATFEVSSFDLERPGFPILDICKSTRAVLSCERCRSEDANGVPYKIDRCRTVDVGALCDKRIYGPK